MAATSSAFLPTATEQPYEYDGTKQNGGDLGASGDSSQNSINLSTGGMVAIIVVVVVVSLVGIATASLFFIAKKREWTMKETLRRSARKVVTAMTPRRTQFPDSVKRDMPAPKPTRSKKPFQKQPFYNLSSDDAEKGNVAKFTQNTDRSRN